MVECMAVSGANFFAGTHGGGVFLSTNEGTTWNAVNSGLENTMVECMAVSGANLFAGTYGSGVFRSTDNGTSWTLARSGLIDWSVFSLAVSGTTLFAGTWQGGVSRSTDDGTSWSTVGLLYTRVCCFALSGTNIFAGGDGGVNFSTNSGASWNTEIAGATYGLVWSLAVSGGNLFVGTQFGGIWRRPLAEIIVSIDRLPTSLPPEFCLKQNYPNPFNPATTIEFAIVNRQLTMVKVFDLWGREVATLVNEVKDPGRHTVEFDGSQLSSGVYFCRLQTGAFTETKKLILLR
jgi:hypothetical protein